MAFELILPDIGEGVVEAEVQRWFVKLGDEVHEDQPLVEVMTDKATVTIPSPRRGRVTKLHYQEGEIAKVHHPLLEMELEIEAEQSPLPLEGRGEAQSPLPLEGGGSGRGAAPVTPAPAPAPALAAGARIKALATPAVRAMARQMGVDLGAVRGSGPGGRVRKEDLGGARNGRAAAGEAGDDGPPAPQRPAPFAEQVTEKPAVTPVMHGDEVVPLRGIRRRIAERMAQSKRTAAHFTFVEQVDVTDLVKVKDRVAAAARGEGVKVTFLPFIVKATVAALKKHPFLNATLDEVRGEIRLRRELHIGIASATEQGLVVPVVRHADRLSISELAREIDRLGADSKAGKARAEDMGGSTFTITSLGAQGGLFATPIINFPEVAILGVHRIRPTPVVREGQIVARDVMHVSLSVDHRVVDGHVAAAFAYALIAYLEDPSLLFMEMV
jgi:pyruvate/2-oxoglutarate dehydrogenase complex dihydrolipoamide acyltransferase (E2) component